MANSLTNSFSERQLALYTEEYYERADLIFRFGAVLSGSREGAERITEETYKLLVEHFGQVKSSASPAKLLMELAWRAWRGLRSENFHKWNAPVLINLSPLGIEQRAVFFAIEIAGLDIKETAKVFSAEDAKIRKFLAEAQEFFARNSARAKELPDDELFFGYIAEYLDGELPAIHIVKFQELATSRQKELAAFQDNRGKFQTALGELGSSEALKHKLRTLAQDDQVRETLEASEIAEVERSEMWSNIVRRSVLLGLVLGLIGLCVYVFMPRKTDKFDIIEYIGYEAGALEDDPEGRINLPSTDPEEIKQFVSTVRGLSFKPVMLHPLKGWNPEGVSIIDYDVLKVVAINYVSPERNNEHLHHFMFAGSMSQLPYKGEEAEYRGLKYRIYGGETLNLIVWQHTSEMVSVIAGHRSAPELAELARDGAPE